MNKFKIKMVDLHSQYLRIKQEVDGAISKVLESTAFIQGDEVSQFETALSAHVNAPVVTCANGTDALQIAAMALGLAPGDEAILPVHTYVATAEVLALLRVKPVFVDVRADSFNIDVSQIESRITSRTKAIVPVHLYGQCADMEAIMALGRRHRIAIIEDTAQALGAKFTFSDNTQKHAGTIGVIGTTSFFPSKNLGCFGDGGALFVNDDTLVEKVRMISNHGQKTKYYHELIGVNSRLDTIQAAVLLVKLKYLNEYQSKRIQVATWYSEFLRNLPLTIPHLSTMSSHVFHQYTIQVERRDELKLHLGKRGIPTMIYYPVPLHLQKAYSSASTKEGSFPVAEKLSKTVLSLPLHTELTFPEVEYICDEIKKFYL